MSFAEKCVISIEPDEWARQTLLLRHPRRRFPDQQLPDDYGPYLRGDVNRDELYRKNLEEFQEPKTSALRTSCGPESDA